MWWYFIPLKWHYLLLPPILHILLKFRIGREFSLLFCPITPYFSEFLVLILKVPLSIAPYRMDMLLLLRIHLFLCNVSYLCTGWFSLYNFSFLSLLGPFTCGWRQTSTWRPFRSEIIRWSGLIYLKGVNFWMLGYLGSSVANGTEEACWFLNLYLSGQMPIHNIRIHLKFNSNVSFGKWMLSI